MPGESPEEGHERLLLPNPSFTLSYMGEMRNRPSYKIMVGKPDGEDTFMNTYRMEG
jgi:hypothetical protein